jgi:hypothetical protein
MAPIPAPLPGLIFRYGYLWLDEFRKRRTAPAKDRPACIVMQVATASDAKLQTMGPFNVQSGDVIILPITTRAPRPEDMAIELTANEKRLCRLDPEVPSWLIVSEFNADTWPSADMALVPGTNQFEYGFATPGLMRRVVGTFAKARQARRICGVKR